MLFGDVFAHALGFAETKNCKEDVAKYTGRYFGVFVGVTRSAQHTVPQWPSNIHGSIGYWDEDFARVSPSSLCNHTFRVAFDAVFHDDRRSYFPELLTDVDAVLDIKFMRLPVRDVDERTGKFVDDGSTFSNNTWGLIVQTKAHRATYLPGVYMDTPWDTIKASVQSKAGVKQGEKTRFVAYRTKRVAADLRQIYAQLLCDNPSQIVNKLGCHFIEFANTCQHVPYSVTVDKQVLYDESQDVRNVASLLDIQQLSERVPCTAKRFESDVLHYVIKYVTQPAGLRQASTFLLTLLQQQKKFPRLQRLITSRLSSELSSMEPEFERGEALVALRRRARMRTPRSIFELNWQAQSSPRAELRPQLRAFIADFTPTTETNFLAVAFEAACALRMSTSLSALFGDLMQRYDIERGLFMFRDGSSRVDITGHIHRGLMMLADDHDSTGKIFNSK
jgi:AMMECR1 domain-containing protein